MKRPWIWIIVLAAVAGGIFAFVRRGAGEADEIEYRYAPVAKAELIRSTTATGVIVAQAAVDVRSKAGGTVVKLLKDFGDVVKVGDVIAEIDPRDTRAAFDQAAADVQSAQARISQAETNLSLQRANSVTAVRDAETALEVARTRLERIRIDSKRTPETTAAAIASAEAALNSAQQEVERFNNVTEPQRRRDAEGAVRQTKAAYEAAEADLARTRGLLEKGYVAQQAVDRAVSTYESARTAFNTAQQRMTTLERDLAIERETVLASRNRAAASLREAKAQGSQVQTSEKQLKEAEQAVIQAEISLQRARDARKNDQLRASELVAARASATRSRVTLDNAKVQLESTVVVAPTDGVITQKYVEVGTVIPPGVSQFSAASNIVQISDVTRLFVDCAVDEADIANIRKGQKVRVITEAFPGARFEGVVTRVNPAAITQNSITSITVRVEILQKADTKAQLLPGMNATCEFITMSKPDALVVPSQAVKRDEQGSYVLVKGTDPKKPVRKAVELGESGNDGVELLSGLAEGEEVVVAEINLRQLRETQQRMMEAQQGGGLAGGGARPGGGMGGGSRAGGGGMGGGGGRPSGGGGGGR